MILQKDHLAEVACQVHPWERCLLVGCPEELDATLNCTFPFIRQQYLNVVLPIALLGETIAIFLPTRYTKRTSEPFTQTP